MFEIIKYISFSYGHRIVNHQGKCRHLHGHNARVEMVLRGDQLNECDMLCDFQEIKASIGQWIDDQVDHVMILNRKDPLADWLEAKGERVYLTDHEPTAEVLAKLLFDQAKKLELPVSEVRFWETPTSCGVWKETHASID